MAARPHLSVQKAARQSHRAGLEAMRDKLAEAMDEAEPAVVAQIAGRLQAVLKELADMAGDTEVSRLDELANRRARREPDAGDAAPSRRKARQQPG